ncbi:MAG TPA: YceI family protein [Candidatus Acidoferrum sp.]|nr:YceI family protein [Candidatus Acidoferrum sp.]
MNRPFKSLLALLTAAVLPVFTPAAGAADKYVGRCDVEFAGDSTLDAFAGDITNVPLTVICTSNRADGALLNTRIEIGARQLTTHNTRRDANMYKMFQSDQFPTLFVDVTNASLAAAQLVPGQQAEPGTLPLRVTICGVTNEVRAVTLNPQPVTNGWGFELETELSLKDFKLKPPTLLFGAITVHDIVKVKARVRVQKENS